MLKFLVLASISLIFSAHALDWQGHRGARGLYPENTIGSMEEALKYPVTTLELDVVISKDEKVVVSHDPWMDETICQGPEGKKISGRHPNLYKLTYDEIIKYDCGSRHHPKFPEQRKVNVGKPLLDKLIMVTEETLKKLNRQNIHYNIEIKSSPENEKKGFQPKFEVFTDLVVMVLQNKLKNERFTLQSFDFRVLKYLHEKYPSIRTSALVEKNISNPNELVRLLGYKPSVYSPYYKELTGQVVSDYKGQGIKVIPWTVNTVSDMKKLMDLGVDGIITDYPNLIAAAESKDCPKKFNLFEGECVKLPRHSLPSTQNPGWMCKPGYVQKRSSCIKINLPPHSVLLPDGKTWECKKGYERYRGTCKKSP